MNKVLIVIDMQNDFITGVLGNEECRAVVPNVVEKVRNTDADIVYTLDTHYDNYADTQEGKKLPEVPIKVDAACCAGVTPESHETALKAMKACQIDIVG